MPRKLRVFLCHASQDKPAVRELYKRLKAESWIDPWLDEEKLSFGQHWTTAIEDALSESDVVLIFLSKNSVQKEGFVQRELNYAWELSLEKPRDVIFLIPFRLDDCQIPLYLGSRQWGDYFGDKKENTYQILLRSLKQRHQQRLKLEDEENVVKEQGERKETIAGLVKDKEAKHERFVHKKTSNEIAKNVISDAAQQEVNGEIPKIEMDRQNKNIRLVGFVWSIILLLVLGGIGLNSLFTQSPKINVASTDKVAQIPKQPTETSAFITLTLKSPINITVTPTLKVVLPKIASQSEAESAFEEGAAFLEDKASEQYSQEELSKPGLFNYTISLEKPETLIWGHYWCALTQEILDQNLSQMEVNFKLNEKNIPLDKFVVYSIPNASSTYGEIPCYVIYTALSDWEAGEYWLTTAVTFISPINDGFNQEFPAGDYVSEYYVFLP